MRKVKLTGYDYDYYITDTGQVYKNEKLLSPANNGLGYLNIKLLKEGRRIHHYVHRLVWQKCGSTLYFLKAGLSH